MLAVIIKGNPKFINTALAKTYYSDIEKYLKALGYKVEFDDGADYTRPRQDADLYVAHSRGVGRFEFMEERNKAKFVKLGSLDGAINPEDKKWQEEVWHPGIKTPPPHEHFIFTDIQKDAILKVGGVPLSSLKNVNGMSSKLSPDLRRLVELAMRDPYLGAPALKNHMENITPLMYKGHTVGFAVPFRETDGYWRTGSIYIEPAFRKKGIAHEWIESFMEGKAGRAWIDPRNASSIAAYTAAGFTKSGRRVKSPETGNWFDEYLTEEAGMESAAPKTILAW